MPPEHVAAVAAPETPAPRSERLTAAVDARVRTLIDAIGRPRARRTLRASGHVAAAVVLALVAFGTVMVATMLRWGYVAAGVLVLAIAPRLLNRVSQHVRALQTATIAPVAVLVPVLGLLGVDVLWASVGIPRPSPAFGLVMAGVVVAGVAYVYLLWVGRPPPEHHRPWALYGAVAGLALASLTGQELSRGNLVLTAAAFGVATWIYLQRAAGPEITHPLRWSLLLVGVTVITPPLLAEAIQGGRTSPVMLIAGALIAAAAGLNGLWLPGRGTERLRAARRAFGIALVFAVAVPLLVFAFARVTSVVATPPTDIPVPAAAATSPLPQAAVDHKPIVLFDSDERLRTPLDVDAMLASGHVELCPQGNGLLAACRTLGGASDLRIGFGNLRFETKQVEDAGLPTTLYAHVVPDALHAGWTDVDYWWYLPDNPANTAQGAMCGAGLVIPEITCFDHQSDWEGVTVVLDERQDPVAVHYAAHGHIVKVTWAALQTAYASRTLARYSRGRDFANRPLVFVARGTHAAYPLPCRSSTCAGDTAFEDNRHDGAHEWPEQPCSTPACVVPFPRSATGGAAAWNAFDGRWGSAVCVATVYCARSGAPKAPGQQRRFKQSWCYDFAASDLRQPRPSKPSPSC